jgi:hypothetical protein
VSLILARYMEGTGNRPTKRMIIEMENRKRAMKAMGVAQATRNVIWRGPNGVTELES